MNINLQELKQKGWHDYKHYRIEEKGVFVELKINGQLTSRLVKYDEFGPETSIHNERPNPWAIGFFISFFINVLIGFTLILQNLEVSDQVSTKVLIAVVVIMGLLAFQVFKFNHEKRINGYNFYLPFSYEKDRQGVDDFIGQLFQARKDFFRDKFMKFDEVTPSETLRFNLQWLYENELISEEELLEWQHKLEERKLIRGD